MSPPRAPRFLLTLAGLLFTASASARPGEWQVETKASYIVLGARAARATGGLMPSLTARHTWPLGKASLALGGDIGLFGLGGDASWMGILGGPIIGIGARPFSVSISLELSAHLDFGRIPVCNLWGLCLRFLGAFPLVQAGMSYAATEYIAAVAACGVRIIQTLALCHASGRGHRS